MLKYEDEKLNHFYENVIYPNSKKLILQQGQMYKENQDSFKEAVLENFIVIFKNIINLQNSNLLKDISVIYYTYLNVNIINKNFVYPILVYERGLFLSEYAEVCLFKADRNYAKFLLLWDMVTKESKKYAGQICAFHVEAFMIEEAKKYNFLLKNFIASIAKEIFKINEFYKIRFHENFSISIGGLNDYPDSMFSFADGKLIQ